LSILGERPEDSMVQKEKREGNRVKGTPLDGKGKCVVLSAGRKGQVNLPAGRIGKGDGMTFAHGGRKNGPEEIFPSGKKEREKPEAADGGKVGARCARGKEDF